MQYFSAATETYMKNKNSNSDSSIESLLDKCHKLPKNSEAHSGMVNMVSKHSNGTLNLWRLQFQENSQYQSLINITHLSRTSGHRYRVSDISSHPILPFLLSNSINENHEIALTDKLINSESENFFNYLDKSNDEELTYKEIKKARLKGIIIWGVEPVGPLNITGGIYELARVDSIKEQAFENIAWFPCFLPSFTLGNSSSSPSTLFASTDYSGITIYQAVFDARTLLHDKNQYKNGKNQSNSTERILRFQERAGHTFSSTSSYSNITDIAFDNFNVISNQSTARPGCIIELDKFADSHENWNKADLFHIYQEDLIFKKVSPKDHTNQQFNESYYLVLLEKKKTSETSYVEVVHMWKINVASAPIFEASFPTDLGENFLINFIKTSSLMLSLRFIQK